MIYVPISFRATSFVITVVHFPLHYLYISSIAILKYIKKNIYDAKYYDKKSEQRK